MSVGLGVALIVALDVGLLMLLAFVMSRAHLLTPHRHPHTPPELAPRYSVERSRASSYTRGRVYVGSDART